MGFGGHGLCGFCSISCIDFSDYNAETDSATTDFQGGKLGAAIRSLTEQAVLSGAVGDWQHGSDRGYVCPVLMGRAQHVRGFVACMLQGLGRAWNSHRSGILRGTAATLSRPGVAV